MSSAARSVLQRRAFVSSHAPSTTIRTASTVMGATATATATSPANPLVSTTTTTMMMTAPGVPVSSSTNHATRSMSVLVTRPIIPLGAHAPASASIYTHDSNGIMPQTHNMAPGAATREMSIWSYLSTVMSGKAPSKPEPPAPSKKTPAKAGGGPHNPNKKLGRKGASNGLRPRRQPRRGALTGGRHPGSPNRHNRRPTRRHEDAQEKYQKASFEHSVCSDPEIEELKQRLLNDRAHPVGSFDDKMWQDAERVVRFLTETEKDTTAAFTMIDRLVKEPDASTHLSFDIMFNAMAEWVNQTRQHSIDGHDGKSKDGKPRYRRGFRAKAGMKGARKSKNEDDAPSSFYVMSPRTLWKRLEAYGNRGIMLDDKILLRLIEGSSLYESHNALHQGPYLAEDVLNYMLQNSKTNPVVRPSTLTFNAVLQAWQSVEPKSVEPAHALLNQLKALHDAGWGDDFMPDTVSYHRVMSMYAHTRNASAVEGLLEEMFQLYVQNGRPGNLMPRKKHFSLVLFAWSKSKDPAAPARGVAVLERMLKLKASGELPTLVVDAAIFNAAMVTWLRLRTKEAATIVEAMFNKMEELSKDEPKLKPTGASYACLVSALIQQDPFKADDTLWRWHHEKEARKMRMEMDDRLLNQLISALYRKREDDWARRILKLAEAVLDGKLTGISGSPSANSMAAHALLKEGTVEAMELAETFVMTKLLGSKQNSLVFQGTKLVSTIVRGWLEVGETDLATSFLTDYLEEHSKIIKTSERRTMSQNIVHPLLKALSKSADTDPNAAALAEELLLQLQRYDIPVNGVAFKYACECRKVNATNGLADEKSPNADDLVAFLDKIYFDGKLHEADSVYEELRSSWMATTSAAEAEATPA